jgi:alpha 1,2-mannosyltransferase
VRGIIISGGGRYLLCALVNIQILRDHGCRLPIELWHFNDERLPWLSRFDLKKWGVKAIPLPDFPVRYSSKPYAIVHSQFDEILCLDADNTPIRNPEFLFQTRAYQETGALFWPDFFRALPNSAWESLAGCDPKPVPEQESGQLLINKNRHRAALAKTLEFNRNYDAISHHLWGAKGDKDTFQLGWYATGSDFHMIPFFPGSCGVVNKGSYFSNTMVQHDPEGRPLFMHKNENKWHPLRKPVNSWETMVFPKDPTGAKVSVKIFYTTHPRTHGMFPPEETYQVPARDHIGDLEERCNTFNRHIRRTPWYLLAILPVILKDHIRKFRRRITARLPRGFARSAP